MALTTGSHMGPMKSWRRSAPAGWVRCIARATRSSIATSRSKFCPSSSRPTPTAWRASVARRRCSPRSTTRTLVTSTASRIQSGIQALVLELVEGPTLADRIAQGPIPLDDAIPIARQIADALECAHEQGIIHRDLKPANIKLRPDSTVKVLDFGLAKALDPAAASSPDAMNSPTLTARGTQLGLIVGTAAYMAPEQARGKAVDRRADIWAFGVVLYEMLSGKRAFEGDDASITLAAVLRDDVDWKALPSNLPPSVLRVLRRCLDKDPKHRLSAIGDARLELEAALQPDADSPVSQSRLSWRHYAAAAVIAGLGVLLGTIMRSAPASTTAAARIEFGVDTPSAVGLSELAMSPDGSHLAFLQRQATGSVAKIWVRPLASETARPIDGTEDATAIFWSPDSRRIGFVARNKLSIVAISGGSPMPLCPIQLFGGATWGADDVILFSDWTNLLRVSAAGGSPVQVLAVDPSLNEERLLSPFFLPGGSRFLFLSWTGEAHQAGMSTSGRWIRRPERAWCRPIPQRSMAPVTSCLHARQRCSRCGSIRLPARLPGSPRRSRRGCSSG